MTDFWLRNFLNNLILLNFMMYRTHLAFGLLAGLIAINYFNTNKYIFIAAVLFGSIFADIDESGSYIGKRTGFLSWAIEFLFGHRGIFHSLLLASLLFLGFVAFGYVVLGAGFLVGYVSHLIADALTVGGVRMFYPFSKHVIRGFIRTDGLLERIFFILVLFAIVYNVIKTGF